MFNFCVVCKPMYLYEKKWLTLLEKQTLRFERESYNHSTLNSIGRVCLHSHFPPTYFDLKYNLQGDCSSTSRVKREWVLQCECYRIYV